MKTVITIEIDMDGLNGYTDEHIAMLWHVAQANPAPHGDQQAGQLVEAIGFEITKRWLKAQSPSVYHHQPKSHYHQILVQHGKWQEPDYKTWAPNPVQEGGAA